MSAGNTWRWRFSRFHVLHCHFTCLRFDDEEKLDISLQQLGGLLGPLRTLLTQSCPVTVRDTDLLPPGGAKLLTANFLFHSAHPEDGRSMGCLVVQIRSLPLLQYIFSSWPGLTVPSPEGSLQLSGTFSSSTIVPHDNPRRTQPHARAHSGKNGGSGGTVSFYEDANDEDAAAATVSGRSLLQRGRHITHAVGPGGNAPAAYVNFASINFDDAATLRRVGFTFEELRRCGSFEESLLLTCGFDAAQLCACGYSAAQLRMAGYTVDECRRAGLDPTQVRETYLFLLLHNRTTNGNSHH